MIHRGIIPIPRGRIPGKQSSYILRHEDAVFA
jgi:hypothetical protein